MKRKEVFQGIISTMQRELPFPVLERDIQLPVDSGQMVTVSGVRRCGKSSKGKPLVGIFRKRVVTPAEILFRRQWHAQCRNTSAERRFWQTS